MSNRKTKRILSELKELEKSNELFSNNGVHYYYNEENINIIYIMIIGSKDTPYENGFYFFKLEYPDNYPMTPPKMNYCTQGILPLYGKLLIKMLKGTKYENIKLYGCIISHLKEDTFFEEFRVPKDVIDTVLDMNIQDYLKK